MIALAARALPALLGEGAAAGAVKLGATEGGLVANMARGAGQSAGYNILSNALFGQNQQQ
jgi:hypothetical protein